MTVADRNERLATAFQAHFGGKPAGLYRAPGRVNLIGEHTDYNDGFVLPVAIDRDVRILGRIRSDRQVRLYSVNFDQMSSFSLDSIEPDQVATWSNYPRGVALYLREAGHKPRGLDAAIEGNVPVGAGLSSSAALEVATATAFMALGGLELAPVAKAVICQRAENRFVGVNCGIMDQFISSLGRAGHALLVDCRSLEYELVPIAADAMSVVVGDTTVKRGLAGSEYNVRRAQCEEGVARLAAILGRQLKALRDVTLAEVDAHERELPDLIARRVRHVVGENERTLEGVAALRAGDLARFGKLMNESHVSLRDLYEVSCAELDALVEAAWKVTGVHGARMTGAGFGGCTVALVETEQVSSYAARVGAEYTARTGLTARFHACRVVDGAGPTPLGEPVA
jgi:galactokinase